MNYKQPKLRPSMAWEDVSIAIEALDSYIRNAIVSKAVSIKTVRAAEVKKYLESFKPAPESAIHHNSIASLLAEYGATQAPVIESQMQLDSVSKQAELTQEPAPLTDDERYDILRLSPESDYTDDDKMFMLTTGTMIMFRRAGVKPVSSEDL